jgi:hypothetical protein
MWAAMATSDTRYMLAFKMVEPRPAFTAYAERLASRLSSRTAWRLV